MGPAAGGGADRATGRRLADPAAGSARPGGGRGRRHGSGRRPARDRRAARAAGAVADRPARLGVRPVAGDIPRGRARSGRRRRPGSAVRGRLRPVQRSARGRRRRRGAGPRPRDGRRRGDRLARLPAAAATGAALFGRGLAARGADLGVLAPAAVRSARHLPGLRAPDAGRLPGRARLRLGPARPGVRGRGRKRSRHGGLARHVQPRCRHRSRDRTAGRCHHLVRDGLGGRRPARGSATEPTVAGEPRCARDPAFAAAPVAQRSLRRAADPRSAHRPARRPAGAVRPGRRPARRPARARREEGVVAQPHRGRRGVRPPARRRPVRTGRGPEHRDTGLPGGAGGLRAPLPRRRLSRLLVPGPRHRRAPPAGARRTSARAGFAPQPASRHRPGTAPGRVKNSERLDDSDVARRGQQHRPAGLRGPRGDRRVLPRRGGVRAWGRSRRESGRVWPRARSWLRPAPSS